METIAGYQPFQHSAAVVIGPYRYRLRRWNDNPQRNLGIIMLNPSTADATQDDPTIRKCVGFARRHGFDGIHVVNLFAFRATDPAELKRQARAGFDVIGPENDQAILNVAMRSALMLLAWGNHGTLQGRDQAVLKLLQGYPTCSIGELSKTGQPKHPLYQPYDSQLLEMKSSKAEVPA